MVRFVRFSIDCYLSAFNPSPTMVDTGPDICHLIPLNLELVREAEDL